jgi:hypothetical protein
MKIKELLPVEPALSALNKCAMSAKTAYQVGRLIAKMKEEIRLYEEARLKLFKTLGALDEEKDVWSIKPENFEQYKTEMNELLEVEVSLDGITKIKLEALEKVQITPEHISALTPFIEAD